MYYLTNNFIINLLGRCGNKVGLTPATHLEPVVSDQVSDSKIDCIL